MVRVAAWMLLAALAAAGPAPACPWPSAGEVLQLCQDRCRRALPDSGPRNQCLRACGLAADRYAAWAAKPCDFLRQGACSAALEAGGEKAPLAGRMAWQLVAKHGCLAEEP